MRHSIGCQSVSVFKEKKIVGQNWWRRRILKWFRKKFLVHSIPRRFFKFFTCHKVPKHYFCILHFTIFNFNTIIVALINEILVRWTFLNFFTHDDLKFPIIKFIKLIHSAAIQTNGLLLLLQFCQNKSYCQKIFFHICMYLNKITLSGSNNFNFKTFHHITLRTITDYYCLLRPVKNKLN